MIIRLKNLRAGLLLVSGILAAGAVPPACGAERSNFNVAEAALRRLDALGLCGSQRDLEEVGG